MYLLPNPEDLKEVPLTGYPLHLFSYLVHTFRQGLLLSKSQAAKVEIDKSTPAGLLCAAYLKAATRIDLQQNKLYSLRMTGPSVKLIVEKLPLVPELDAKGIFQLCVWRSFAFGNPTYTTASTLPISSFPPDLTALKNLIVSWGTGATAVSVPAYGAFQFQKKHVGTMLAKWWELSLQLEEMRKKGEGKLEFAAVSGLIYGGGIPSVPKGGLVVWLFGCDLVEYGLSHPPTGLDLATHISSKSGPSGPSQGLSIIAQKCGIATPKDLAALFDVVIEGFQEKNIKLTGGLKELVDECEKLQGRKLGIADFEHGLCKIAREAKVEKGLI